MDDVCGKDFEKSQVEDENMWFFNEDGSVNTNKIQVISRSYPQAIAG